MRKANSEEKHELQKQNPEVFYMLIVHKGCHLFICVCSLGKCFLTVSFLKLLLLSVLME